MGERAQGLTGFAYAPDGKTVALIGVDGVLRLVRADSGKAVQQMTWIAGKKDPDGGGRVEEVFGATGFTADGRTVLAAGFAAINNGLGSAIQFFEVATGRPRFQHEFKMSAGGGGLDELDQFRAIDEVILAATPSPAGRRVVTAGFLNFRLWEPGASKEARLFGGRDVLPWTVAFSPDGQWLLAGRKNGALRVWDVRTTAVLADLPLHDGAITALTFSADGKRLATGSADTTGLVWDWAYLRTQVLAAKPTTASPAQLEALWQGLAGEDAAQANRAQVTLRTTPAKTVAFLKAKLKPVPPVDPARLEKLLTDLDSKQFAVRQQATKELEKLGDLAAAALEKQLEGKLPLEVQRRVEALRDKLQGPLGPGPVLQALRAVEVLEHIDTPEARQVLAALAAGAAGHRLTVDAAAAVRRLKQKTP